MPGPDPEAAPVGADAPLTEEEFDEFQAEMEEVLASVLEKVLPVIVDDVARQLAADPWTPAAARAPAVVRTDYSPLIAEAFDAVDGPAVSSDGPAP